jgi:hypothetical protein
MYIPFENITDTARLWVYTANRPLSAEEVAHINKAAPVFLENWTAHGAGLQASYTILENQFLVLAVNEEVANASGCSIDSSVAFVRSLEDTFGISFTDRSLVPFYINGEVEIVKLPELKAAVATGRIKPESTLINTLVTTKAQLIQEWHKPAGETWLKRYF